MSLHSLIRSRTSGLIILAMAVAACSKDTPGEPPPPPPPPPTTPTIALSPATVAIADTVGTTSPAAVTVAVSNSGTGTLNGLSLGTISYGAGASGWLTAAISGADAPATITLTASNAGRAAGTYTATVPVASSVASTQSLTVTFTLSPVPAVAGSVIFASGNIGHCAPIQASTLSANLLASDANATILALGDNAYPQTAGGPQPVTLQDYQNCYGPNWGQYLNRTYAAVGNTEQDTNSLSAGADAYFGPSRVGPPNRNYYSFDLGTWHVIVLNVISGVRVVGYGNSTTQLNWLTADLAAHPNQCVLAVWHDPMWRSSDTPGQNGIENSRQSGVWRELYNAGADVVINGGEHIYERMDPMYYDQPSVQKFIADPARGLRQFNAGLAGDGSASATVSNVHPMSRYRHAGAGVLKMTLGTGAYSWGFVNLDGSITDAGQATCH